MKIQEHILKFLHEQRKSYKADRVTLAKSMEIEQSDYQYFFQALKILEKDNKIMCDRNGNYFLMDEAKLTKGKIHIHPKGFGFITVENEEEDYFVTAENVSPAIEGDIVLFEKIADTMHPEKFAAKVVKVVEHSDAKRVGTIENFNKTLYKIIPDDQSLMVDIFVRRNENKELVVGQKVLFELKDFSQPNRIIAEIIEIIGHKNDPGVDVLSIVKEYGIPTIFPEAVYKELKDIPDQVESDELEGRRNLTKEMVVTIDGADAKDLDDAISIRQNEKGNYLLGVHIADVSNYVKLGSPIDNEAYVRGTSVYLADRVIPMLPHQLSNGICSLNENVLRLALSCEMEITPQGKVVNREVFKSVIKTAARMTYSDVNDILEDKNEETTKKYHKLVPMFQQMHELSDILSKMRHDRGALDFEIDEAKIIVDEDGKVLDIQRRERGISERIIEQFMIEANETVAKMFTDQDIPFIYRIHGLPKDSKLDIFKQVASSKGVKVGAIKDAASLKPKVLQDILAQINSKKEHSLIATLLLKAMNKAEYNPKNIGHFGLAATNYTHFTSPIRRYPDLMVHRLIKQFILGENMGLSEAHLASELAEISQSTSEDERRAIECERDVESMKMAEYMEQFIGSTYTGVISGITATSMFVELPNLVEGRIAVESLSDDFYVYIPEKAMMLGRRTAKKYNLGDEILVKLVYANKEESAIRFEIEGLKPDNYSRKSFNGKKSERNTKNGFRKNNNSRSNGRKKYSDSKNEMRGPGSRNKTNATRRINKNGENSETSTDKKNSNAHKKNNKSYRNAKTKSNNKKNKFQHYKK